MSAADYHEMAIECLRLADDAPDSETADGLVDMARLLVRMAKADDPAQIILTDDPAPILKTLRRNMA